MEFKAKRESSQNTFFLSSGVLEELDHYLNEPISRNSRILSRKSIPIIGKDLFGNDTQGGEKLDKFAQIIEIEEDVDTLMNFIDIENKRQGEYEKNNKEEILEMEKCFKSYNFFSFQSIKNKSSHEHLDEEVKSGDPKLDLMVFYYFFIFLKFL